MAEVDWTTLSSPALGTIEVPRGVTNAFTRPHGGGSFCFGFRSADSSVGFAGYAVNLANFNPIASGKGAKISCAIKKYQGGQTFAPMFGLIKGLAPNSEGYLFGLTEGASYHYACKKGTPDSGLSASSSSILPDRISDAMDDMGDGMAAWHHLRMDVIVNPHSEVHLKFFKNTLAAAHTAAGGPVDDPEWLAIDGMEDFIDDSLGVLTNTAGPHTGSFYAIFGHYTSNCVGAVSLFDHFAVERQTLP